jgi:pimeloyl-ACP methyl ester carboxylesterase
MLAPQQAGPVPLWPGSLLDVGGRRIFLRSAGSDGEPVLCVHGLEGSSANWTDLMALMLPEFVSRAVDLPGFGHSPPSEAGYSITAQADAVTAVIEQVCGGPVHLVGNSLGGAVSVRVAARRPDLVRTLTLISPVLPDRRPDPYLFRFPLLCVPGLGGALMRQVVRIPPELRVRATAAAICYDASGLHPARLGEEAVEIARRDGLVYAARATVGTIRSLVAERFSGQLWRDASRVRARTLAIFGSHDRFVDPRLAGRAARAFRGSRVIVLPETGHVAQLEHPAKVAAEIRECAQRARGLRLHWGSFAVQGS